MNSQLRFSTVKMNTGGPSATYGQQKSINEAATSQAHGQGGRTDGAQERKRGMSWGFGDGAARRPLIEEVPMSDEEVEAFVGQQKKSGSGAFAAYRPPKPWAEDAPKSDEEVEVHVGQEKNSRSEAGTTFGQQKAVEETAVSRVYQQTGRSDGAREGLFEMGGGPGTGAARRPLVEEPLIWDDTEADLLQQNKIRDGDTEQRKTEREKQCLGGIEKQQQDELEKRKENIEKQSQEKTASTPGRFNREHEYPSLAGRGLDGSKSSAEDSLDAMNDAFPEAASRAQSTFPHQDKAAARQTAGLTSPVGFYEDEDNNAHAARESGCSEDPYNHGFCLDTGFFADAIFGDTRFGKAKEEKLLFAAKAAMERTSYCF